MISKKKQKGVTLISLVITIIILIILASISIKVLLGEDGLITKAKEAKKAQKISEIKESISLEISVAQAEAILRNEKLEKAQIKDIIEPKYGTLKEDGDTIVTKEWNYEISLQEIYYGALSESGSYSAKVEQVEMLEQELADLKEQYKTLEKLNQGSAKVYYLGSVNNGGTLNVASKLPSDYKNLKIENFIIMPSNIAWAQGRIEQGSSAGTWGKSYNSSTGILSVSASYSVPSNDGGGTHGIAYTSGNKVYCVIGTITTL